MPPTPIDAAKYAEAGPPWFECYDDRDGGGVKASKALEQLRSLRGGLDATVDIADEAVVTLCDGGISSASAAGCAAGRDESTGRDESKLPRHLTCPITLDLFADPVITPHGHTFERGAIEREIDRSGRCPLTKQPLRWDELRPNFAIRDAAEEERKQPLKK